MCDTCLSLGKLIYEKVIQLKKQGVPEPKILESLMNVSYCMSRYLGADDSTFIIMAEELIKLGNKRDREVTELKRIMNHGTS